MLEAGDVSELPTAARDERWTGTDTWLFVSFALGYTLEAYIFTLAPVATGWVKEPASLRSLLLSWAPIWLIIGIGIAGPLGDWLGRRRTFYLTMCCYGIGAIGLYFSSTYVLLLIFLAVLLAAAGGEMNMIMVAVHETMPTKHRSKAALLGVNFINLGGVIIAIVDLSSAAKSVNFQRDMVASALLGVLVVLLFARTRTPESPRWLVRRGRPERARAELIRFYGAEEVLARRRAVERAQDKARAEATAKAARSGSRPRRYPPIWLRLTAVIFVAFADTTGFGLLTYTLGPVHFPHLETDIILATTLAGFCFGFLGLLADRLSRRWLLLVGYAGSLVFTGIAWATESTWVKALALFWVLLVVLSVFANIAYITEDTLKGEVWPTRYRARFTALCRFISIGGYIGTIYWTSHFTTSGLIFFNTMVWVVGLIGALIWFFGGIETGKGTDIETVSGGGGTELLELPPATGSDRLVGAPGPAAR
ncbi:MAG: MFS transporter [Acidimicrobiales bacterium]